MPDFLPRISGNWLACVGSRCWTRTKAIPVLDGKCSSSCENASRPPAEAPAPTMGKAFPGRGDGFPSLVDPRLVRESGNAEAGFAMGGAGAAWRTFLRGDLRSLFFAIPDPPCGTPAAGSEHDVSAWHWSVPCADTIKSYLPQWMR